MKFLQKGVKVTHNETMLQSYDFRKFIQGRWLVDMLLPPTCAVCQVILARGEDLGLCPSCWKDLPRWKKSHVPLPRLPLHLDSFDAPFLYEGAARDLILQLKFADKTELAPVLAPFMIQALPKIEDALLVPIPLHKKRLRKRLFNQAVLLAQEISKKANIPLDIEVLQKIIHTTPQAQKSAKGRAKLAQSVFEVVGDVNGKNIILIDDIYTTGSTLNAAAGQLKKAGAASVHAVTVAYTAP